MKRYNSIKLSTDVEETDGISFEEEMLDFSYKPEEENLDEIEELQPESEMETEEAVAAE